VGDTFPALRAVGLLRSPSFAVFFGVSFIITIVLAFYYGFTPNYLGDSTLRHLSEEARNPTINLGFTQFRVALTVATFMTIGQFAEMFLLPCLPFFLRWMGMKWVLAMGMLAWGVRYFIFALGAEQTVGPWVVIASLALHGVCFDFFFAAGFIYVDNEAPPQIRASGQALFTFLTYGLGMWLGNIVSGYVVQYFTVGSGETAVSNWYAIWLVPSVGVLVALVIFVAFFHLRPRPQVAKAVEKRPEPWEASPTGSAPTDIVSQQQKEGVY
jgi:MFS family permease